MALQVGIHVLIKVELAILLLSNCRETPAMELAKSCKHEYAENNKNRTNSQMLIGRVSCLYFSCLRNSFNETFRLIVDQPQLFWSFKWP